MKKKLIGIIIICSFFQSFNVIAQPRGCDPWIVAIYKELYQRNPTVAECTIKNYNNGSWSSYDQLKELIKAYQKASVTLSPASVTGDPWITAIYKSLYQRLPNSWELNINNYNGGSWKSYDELTSYIRDFQINLQKNGIIIETAMLSVDKSLVAFKKDGVYIAANLLSNKNGSIIAAGGGNIVAAGGGNIVAAGGGNIVIKVGTGLAGAFHGSQYSLQSGAKLQVPASGKTSLVFK